MARDIAAELAAELIAALNAGGKEFPEAGVGAQRGRTVEIPKVSATHGDEDPNGPRVWNWRRDCTRGKGS
jgi:hypothetical protein